METTLPTRFSQQENKLSFLRVHRFGVNYVPSQNWYYCYNEWKPEDIRRDMEAIADLGADHIRVMVIWPWFQPNPAQVSSVHLDHLEEMLSIAAEYGLDVMVTLYNGGLSGYAFDLPYFDKKTFYSAPEWQKAQALLLEKIAERMQGHTNFLGFDIGNELNVNWQTNIKAGNVWMKLFLEKMRSLYPEKVHVNGVDHKPWFFEDTFSPQALVAEQPIVALHCWSFWTGAGRHSQPLGKPYTALTAGMTALARSYGNDPQKPIWIEEFGACSEEMPEKDVPRWLELSFENALSQGVSWFTWWASHDIDRRFLFHPFEYTLGLLTTENKIKEQGRVFKRFAEAYRGKPVVIPTSPLPPPPSERTDESTWRWLLDWMGEKDHSQ
jgi:endo-1,4-beta-mannosidase